MSYPLIADGRVFVTVKNSVGQGTTLYALNAANGAVIWSSALGGDFWWSAACYENGRVFAIDKDGHLYTIVVSGADQAGNSASATTTLRIN